MMGLVSKFCKARKMVLDTCTNTYATAKVFLHLPKHRRLVDCEKDSAGFPDALTLLVEVYAKVVLSLGSDIAENQEADE